MALRSLFSSPNSRREGRSSRSRSSSQNRRGKNRGNTSSNGHSSSYNSSTYNSSSYTGSSSSSNSNSNYASSYTKSSSSSSRRSTTPQADDDVSTTSSRRRNFSFMKYGGSEKRDSITRSKAREHTREIARAVSTDEYSVQTPTSATSRSIATTHLHGPSDFDPFNNNSNNSSMAAATTQRAISSSMLGAMDSQDFGSDIGQSFGHTTSSNGYDQQRTNAQRSGGSTNAALGLGWGTTSAPSSASTRGIASRGQSTRPASGGKQSYNSDVMSERAFKDDPFVVSANGRRPKQKSHRLDKFVERQQRKSPSSFPSVKPSASYAQTTIESMSATGWPGASAGAERSVISMPTLPSNSTMQASFVRQTISSSDHSQSSAPPPSQPSSSSATAAGGAAARRRMRANMRHTSSTFSGSSSVCSDNSHTSSFTNASPMAGAPPPDSPGRRYAGAPPPVPTSTPSQASRKGPSLNQFMATSPTLSRSKMSSGASTFSQSSSNSNGANLFDSNAAGAGFTFDAFGLDQGEIEREVDEAMESLANQETEFSTFFDRQSITAPSPTPPRPRSESPADEFVVQGWDSPASSRQGTPTPPEEQDGFVDGFKIAKQTLPSTPLNHDENNSLFSQQSGYRQRSASDVSRNNQGAPIPASSPATMPQYSKGHRTPPRWEKASSQRSMGSMRKIRNTPSSSEAAFNDGDIGRGTKLFAPDRAETIAPPAFDDPINPWKEDPWRYNSDSSSPEDNDMTSDHGTNSDIGTKSDFAAPSFRPFTHPQSSTTQKFASSKSDVGTKSTTVNDNSTRGRSVRFHADVRLPPEPFHNDSDGDDHSQLQSEFTDEFSQASQSRLSNAQDLAAGYLRAKRSQDDFAFQEQQQPQSFMEQPQDEHQFEARFHETNEIASGSVERPSDGAEFDNEQSEVGSSIGGAQSDFADFSAIAANHERVTVRSQIASSKSDVGTPRASLHSLSSPLSRTLTDQEHEESRRSSRSSQEEKKEDGGVTETTDLKAKWRKWESKATTAQPSAHVPRSPSPSPVRKNKPAVIPYQTQSLMQQQNYYPSKASPTATTTTTKTQSANSYSASRVQPTGYGQNVSHAASPRSALRTVKPDVAAAARQDRLAECTGQRNSFASFRERLRPAQSKDSQDVKSPMATMQRHPHDTSNGVGSRVSQFSSPRQQQSQTFSSTSVPSSSPRQIPGHPPASPQFASGVTLRKTQVPSGPSPSHSHSNQGPPPMPSHLDDRDYHGGRQSLEQAYMQQPEQNQLHQHNSPHHPTADEMEQDDDNELETATVIQTAPPKKMTYRERRELELRREREEKEKQESQQKTQSPPKRDVASLIKRRIAANKQKAVTPKNDASTPSSITSSNKVADFRSNLKPVKAATSPANSLRSPSEATMVQHRSSPHTPMHTEREVDHNSQAQMNLQNVTVRSQASAMPQSTRSQETARTSQRAAQDQPQHFSFREATSPKTAAPQAPPTTVEIKHPKPNENRFQKFVDAKKTEAADGGSVRSQETPATVETSQEPSETNEEPADEPSDVQAMLSNFLGAKLGKRPMMPPTQKKEEDAAATLSQFRSADKAASSTIEEPQEEAQAEETPSSEPSPPYSGPGVALKDDPKYARYFKMLKVGLPMEQVKHAIKKAGWDPSVMDRDHNKPLPLPLKADPEYAKYFKMLKIGISIDQVKHLMKREGKDPDVMDQDHNLPAATAETRTKQQQKKKKPTHRRTRLHWQSVEKIQSNSMWEAIHKDPKLAEIDIDQDEFDQLFKADLTPVISPKNLGANQKRGAGVRVIDSKRANNGGIILARLKMNHDEMADAVDKVDDTLLSSEQIENIIEYLPTKEERRALEKYMLEGDYDAAEKFDSLCECEKFMVSMMTVKHARRKVRALLFKLQMMEFVELISKDTIVVEQACDEVKTSTRLRRLLGVVLQVGNRMNLAGTEGKQKAGAFTLDSLSKLNEAKALDKKTTVLQYVVLLVRRKDPELLEFSQDIPTVLKADKIYWDQCINDLDDVESQFENIRRISLHLAREKASQQGGAAARIGDDDDDASLGSVKMSGQEECQELKMTQVGLFTLAAMAKVNAVRQKIEATTAKFKSVLEYFGHNDRNAQPHDIFEIIGKFSREFQKELEVVVRNEKKKEREERKNARLQQQQQPQQPQHASQPRGRPPAGRERPPTASLRLSSMQPSMSKVVSDIRHATAKAAPPKLQPKPQGPPAMVDQALLQRQIASRVQNQVRPSPQNPPSLAAAAAAAAAATLGGRSAKSTASTAMSTSTATTASTTASNSTSASTSTTPKSALVRQRARLQRQQQEMQASMRASPISVGSNDTAATLVSTKSAEPAAQAPTQVARPPSPKSKSEHVRSSRRLSPRSMARHRRRLDARRRMSQSNNAK